MRLVAAMRMSVCPRCSFDLKFLRSEIGRAADNLTSTYRQTMFPNLSWPGERQLFEYTSQGDA